MNAFQQASSRNLSRLLGRPWLEIAAEMTLVPPESKLKASEDVKLKINISKLNHSWHEILI
jgi:hypothetical protein